MDKDNFLTTINHFQAHLNKETLSSIQGLRDAHPYCNILQELLLLNQKAIKGNYADHLPLAAIYSSDRNLLKRKLKLLDVVVENVKKKNDKVSSAKSKKQKDEEQMDIFSEIDSFEEISLKTAPKHVLIEKFLEIQSPKINKPKDYSEHSSHEAYLTEHKDEEFGIISETLAMLYEKKEFFAKAVQMYEQLSLKYPEKSNTFANQIERLNSLINNSN